jgi:hypothetical protein
VSLLDPRSSALMTPFRPHADNRPPYAVMLGLRPYLLTSGASRGRKREVFVWDARKLGSSGGCFCPPACDLLLRGRTVGAVVMVVVCCRAGYLAGVRQLGIAVLAHI